LIGPASGVPLPTITVSKDPNCGGYIAHLLRVGFEGVTVDTPDLRAMAGLDPRQHPPRSGILESPSRAIALRL
jgi:hypothetical protein